MYKIRYSILAVCCLAMLDTSQIAGTICVSMGSKLISNDLLKSKGFATLEEREKTP